jgi:fermentation-respiration switch protein FrsA (DUF1100 family)
VDRWVLGAGALAGVAGLTVAASAFMAHYITRPRPLGHASGSELGTLIDDVHFRADDGVTLHGWYFGHPTPKSAVALGHGFGMTRADLIDLARALRDLGYAVLLFDFRAHGGSGGRRSTIGYHEARDMVAAVRYLHRHPDLAGCRIGALGMSMGAAAAIIAAAQEPLIAAVVADSGYTSLQAIVAGGLRRLYRLPAFPFAPLIVRFGEALVGARIGAIRPVDYIARIAPRPILIVHGERDRLIPVAEGHALHAAAAHPKEFWIAPDMGHVRAATRLADDYLARIDAFFGVALVTPSPVPNADPAPLIPVLATTGTR